MSRKPGVKQRSCYCTAKLRPDGTCPHRCPPEARPRLLRATTAKLAAREKKASGRDLGGLLRTEEVRAAKEPDPHAKQWRSHWTRGRGKRRCLTVGCRRCERCTPSAVKATP